jgi:hypothetical protein
MKGGRNGTHPGTLVRFLLRPQNKNILFFPGVLRGDLTGGALAIVLALDR